MFNFEIMCMLKQLWIASEWKWTVSRPKRTQNKLNSNEILTKSIRKQVVFNMLKVAGPENILMIIVWHCMFFHLKQLMLNTQNREKSQFCTYWYDPSVLRQVPPCEQGIVWHSSTSSEQVLPRNPFGHWHLKSPPGNDMQVPLLSHGEEAHKFCFSQYVPACD